VLTDTDSSDIKNQPLSTQQPRKKACCSLTKSESFNDDLAQLKEFIVAEGKKWDENQKEMVETLRESTQVYEKTSEKYLSAILQLSKQNIPIVPLIMCGHLVTV
jgi:3'-phosphoadenosine 5'-phosphosulfate sulfotransferase (PAPS reductase)/FAD synthetase